MSASEGIADVLELERRLSQPTPEVSATLRRQPGDILLLGVAGKLGPSLARMARRAADGAGAPRRVIGVARFSNPSLEAGLQRDGIETIRCDLLDEAAVARLPDAPNIIYLAGMKFGATGNESLTWAMNTWLPSVVCRRYPRSRIIAFSTGNVYGPSPVKQGGSQEIDPPAPVGEYAMSCLGRERLFEHFSRAQGTSAALIRLNYACDLRYGVLVDLAQKVASGEPVDLSMGWFNIIWQGDANAFTLRALDAAANPPFVLNLTGPETLNVRETCQTLGRLLGREPVFTGQETGTALLSNTALLTQRFGQPQVSAETLIGWVADWLKRGGPVLNKPTHFESRDGKF